MLLKRLVEGFRSQDWFTVFVELMALVVGIFLGLQADDWNQRRLDRIAEQHYLDRLGRDFERSLSEQQQQMETAKAKFEDALYIQEALEARDPALMADAAFQDRMGRIRGFPALALVSATTDELIATGNISLMQSNRLREELSAFAEWYGNLERYYGNVSGSIIDAYNRQLTFLKPGWTVPADPPAWSADTEALMNDPDAVASMRQLTSSYWVLWRDLRLLHTETREMYELLVEITGGRHETLADGTDGGRHE